MYHALYRKYRPKDFDSVVGQDAIVRTLRNSIKNQNFSHAYLFYGPRGTGKTTVSKIFARNVNCLEPIDGIACEKCDACKVSFSKDCVDIIEIDAASNNGVDEIRELKSKISLVPSELKYKVYIIDEVHMLSIGAFNALLKTLEEPPDHAIFILATTDFQKVPSTIVSRCQCYAFKRISEDDIVKRLKFICKQENISIDDEVINKIAILSDGGLRDALGSLDKLVSYTDDKITLDDFNDLNGIVSDEDLSNFLNYILSGNVKEVISSLETFNSNGKNLIQIMIQLVDYLRNILVDYYISNKKSNFSISLVENLANFLNEKIVNIKSSSNTRIYVEILLLKFMNDNVFDKNVVVEKNNVTSVSSTSNDISSNSILLNKNEHSVVQSVDNIETKGNLNEKDSKSKIVTKQEKDMNKVPVNISDIMKVRVNNTFVSASKDLLKEEIKKFNSLKDYCFDQDFGYVVCNILDGQLRLCGEKSIVITYNFDSTVQNNYSLLDKITEVYNKLTKSNKLIAIVSNNDWNNYKNEYIANLKNKVEYKLLDEAKPVFEDTKKDDIISSSAAVELFGDIVEVK